MGSEMSASPAVLVESPLPAQVLGARRGRGEKPEGNRLHTDEQPGEPRCPGWEKGKEANSSGYGGVRGVLLLRPQRH